MGMVLGSFLACTALVLIIAFAKSRKVSTTSSDGYFLGGRSLTGGVIAASLLLTNLSATHFVGMTSDVYRTNMSTIGWEIAAVVCLAIVALFLLPRYLKGGITTIPEFLEERYDKTTKTIATILFIVGYLFNMLPITLYAGAVTLNQIFDISGNFGISYEAGIWVMVILIGLIGCIYAIFGGLKAVATADTVNGVLLVIGGILIPIFGLLAIGNGNIMTGLTNMIQADPSKLNAIGSKTDLLPFSTTFTGMGLIVLYFWGTDQAIIQRALAAKNLKEGQKGVVLAGALKMLTPIILMVPGLIAYAYYGPGIANPDTVYPSLVNDLLPKPLVGIFVAAMFGAILSTFNGVLNSTSTLFAMDLYAPASKKELKDEDIVKAGKKFGLVIAVLSMVVAPFIMYAPQGLYTHLQMINGLTNGPILTAVLVGYISKRAPAFSAKISMIFFFVVYGITQIFVDTGIHYLHIFAILFVICVAFMLISAKLKPRATDYVLVNKNVVNIKPWKHRYEVSSVLVGVMVGMYILLSNKGIANENGATVMTFVWMAVAFVIVMVLGYILKKAMKPSEMKFYGVSEDEV